MPPAGATTDIRRRLRRETLKRQGLLHEAPFGRGHNGTRRAIEALGYVQIDTISVVSRAHDHVLQSRVPGYRPEMLERLQAEGSVFEYWAHAAAYLPMRDYRFAIPHMQAMRERRVRWVRSHDRALMARVLDRVRLDGPMQAREFEAPADHRNNGWWEWKPAKRALEQLFMQGDLMVAGRVGFQKVYDLAERVLPGWVDTRAPTLEEYARHLIDGHVTAHGFTSPATCAYQRRMPGLRSAIAGELAAAERAGELVEMRLAPPGGSSERIWADPAALAGRAPAAPSRARVLSPFDNAIIQRPRAQRLFGFDYQLECYVPEAKRRFGYFCLPILYRDRFVGRADCKAHRSSGLFEVRGVFVEHADLLDDDPEAGCRAIATALAELAAHNGCTALELRSVQPQRWRAPLSRACRRVNC